MNTAQHRLAAQAAEDLRDYATAAHHYEQAAAKYPAGQGALRDRDIKQLQVAAARCKLAGMPNG